MKALSIDLGGTHATCAVIEDREITSTEAVRTDATRGLQLLLPLIANTLRKLASEAAIPLSNFSGLAFSFCGMVNNAEGRVTSTNQKYDDATAIDFGAWSKRELGLPMRIENDARMALLGEWYAGAAQGFHDVVMFTLGTGIGGAAMIEGHLLRGKHHQAGCLGGHFPALFNGRKCTCGAIGCAEAEASGWSLPLVCGESAGFEKSALAREKTIDFESLFRHAKAGDPVAIAVRDRCIRIWSANTVAAIHAFDPELVVYGGSVMLSADAILPAVQSYVNEHAWTPWGKVQVRPAKLGNYAALLGAVPLLTEGLAVSVA